MYELILWMEDTTPYAEATLNGDVSIDLWCNDHSDLLYITGGETSEAVEAVRAAVGIAEIVRGGTTCVIVTESCLLDTGGGLLDEYVERHDCLLLSPIQYQQGGKRSRILALSSNRLSALYRSLSAEHDVTVERKREITKPTDQPPLLSLDGVLPTFTDRQREVLRAAHRMGYYAVPRETTTVEIAAEFDIDRRTAEHHLRHAENKLIDALIEHVA